MTDSLWQTKVDLAAALRLAAHFDLHEGIDNHFSCLVPGTQDRFLLNPYGLHWSEVTASSIIEVDLEGRVLGGEGEAESTAYCIHSRVHATNPKARCVLHTHMPYATTLTTLEDGALEPLSQTALMFYNDVAYDSGYQGLGNSPEEGQRIADALNGKRVLFLANHGVIVASDSIAGAFARLYYLERACQTQVLALSTGRPLRRVTDNVAANTFGDLDDWDRGHARIYFDALKRLLDRENPGYDQ